MVATAVRNIVPAVLGPTPYSTTVAIMRFGGKTLRYLVPAEHLDAKLECKARYLVCVIITGSNLTTSGNCNHRIDKVQRCTKTVFRTSTYILYSPVVYRTRTVHPSHLYDVGVVTRLCPLVYLAPSLVPSASTSVKLGRLEE
jgi:hypothetical protein